MSTADEPRTEAGRIEADAAYWRELATALGWQLHSFTFRDHASFLTQHRGDSLPGLTGAQCDDILRALAEARQTEPRPDALRSHAFPHCEVCGTAVDDPEAMEMCAALAIRPSEAAASEEEQ